MPFAGYNEVVRIPSGATNIDVRQHSYSGKPEDDNYLGKISKTVLYFIENASANDNAQTVVLSLVLPTCWHVVCQN